MKSKSDLIQTLQGALIVSSQAAEGEALNKPEHLFALAQSALVGGARALRLEGEENIAYARARCQVPIIGLIKSPDQNMSKEEKLSKVYITEGFAEAQRVSRAGADFIAIDATSRPRPSGISLEELIKRIKNELELPVWADISTLEEGISAAKFGADIVSTTLWGYTQETKQRADTPPNFELLASLIEKLATPVVLEGRVWHPEELNKGFHLGAFAVVVGSAITRPQLITKRFVKAIPLSSGSRSPVANP